MLYTTPGSKHTAFAKDPAVIEFGGRWLLYHSIMSEDKLGIGIASSDDGDSFLYQTSIPPTLECELTGIGAPSVIELDGRLHLFYQNYGTGKLDCICHAVSDDGIKFEKDESSPVFAPREPWSVMPEWSCGRAIDADICVFKDKLLLYFATRDKEFRRQIVGVASADLSSDFGSDSFKLHPELVLEPTLPWELTCIEAPASIVHNGKVYLFYAGGYNCAPQQIGCAVSEDGVHFERLSDVPLLANGKSGEWNANESGHPYIYRASDGRIWLYYQGSSDMGKNWYLSRREVIFENGIPVVK